MYDLNKDIFKQKKTNFSTKCKCSSLTGCISFSGTALEIVKIKRASYSDLKLFRNIFWGLFVFIFFSLFLLVQQAEAAEKTLGLESKKTLGLELKKDLGLELKVGQMIMVGFRGTGLGDNEESINKVLKGIHKGRIGGVIYFSRDSLTGSEIRNIINIKQLELLSKRLQREAKIPLFIAIDQEGGRVRRLKSAHGMPMLPEAALMGENEAQNTYELALETGKYLKKAGINLNFAPSVDININPDCPAIGRLGRSFSDDADTVSKHAKAFVQGLSENGIIATYKHFPGHGSSAGDTHEGLTDISKSWQEVEIEPYKDLLPHTAPAMVMVGHVMHRDIDPLYPASLSKAIIFGLLRENIGWQGVVVTDDLDMGAVEASGFGLKDTVFLAIDAGVDILLFGNNLDYDPELGGKIHGAIMELLAEEKISAERINESYQRIMNLKSHFMLGRN